MDLEGWATYRTGRNYFFNQLDTRIEMEVGLTDKLQTALYFNGSHRAYGANKDTLGGIKDTSVSGIFSESDFSISNEWKLKILDASADPIGLGLYGEITLGPNIFELENKIIIDKRTEKNIFAFNIVNAYAIYHDVQKGKTITKKEDEVELDFACMHYFKPNFGIGIEATNNNEIENGNWNFSAVFAGPTFFYSGDKHFLILNLLPQWTNLHKTEDAPNNLVLNAHEKFEIRLLLGFSH